MLNDSEPIIGLSIIQEDADEFISAVEEQVELGRLQCAIAR